MGLSEQLEFVLFDRVTKRLATIHQYCCTPIVFSPTNRLGSFFIHAVRCVKTFLDEWISHVCDDLSKLRYLTGK